MTALNIPYINYNSMVLPSTIPFIKATAGIPSAPGSLDTVSGVSFADFFKDAISNTIYSDYGTKLTDIGMLSGETQDLHTIGLAGQKAEILLNLTVQMRNRVIEAYQEVMRMQV